MILCQCQVVTERVIECAIACGAHTVDDVARACGAGAGCGGCRPAVDALLRQADVRTEVPVRRSA